MLNITLSSKVCSRKGEMTVHQLELGPEGFFHVSSQQLAGDDDEVNESTGGGPGSIRDIWKKFDLTPTPLTPPLSPSRQTATSGAASPTYLTSSAAADTLQCVSDILDLDRTSFADHNLTSKLIQDCMWGSNFQEKGQRKRRIESVYDTPCSTPPSLVALDYVYSTDCVDPSAVFPYHINNQDFTSGESSDDEIDVVTIIEKPVKRKCSTPCNNNNNISGSKAFTRHEPSAKRPKLVNRRTRESVSRDSDESCSELAHDASNRLAGREKLEDPECKRNVHNVLERKRRNDLKYSFQVLRDSIPDLKGSERAPKVAILRRATDCILNLKSEQEGLLEEKHLLQKKHQSLQQKLKSLKESS